MAKLYAEGRKATYETADDIIFRLEEKKNYIPVSELVRREYTYALLQEYKKFINDHSDRHRGYVPVDKANDG